jgi:hypothetical protein
MDPLQQDSAPGCRKILFLASPFFQKRKEGERRERKFSIIFPPLLRFQAHPQDTGEREGEPSRNRKTQDVQAFSPFQTSNIMSDAQGAVTVRTRKFVRNNICIHLRMLQMGGNLIL